MFHKMNKTIVIVVFLFFSFHYSSTAQEGLITCKDTVNIRFRAENRIMALQDRMNFITWGSTTKQDFDESYTTATKGQARLFYNDSVIISNDVDPQLIISNKRNENLYVKMYLNQLYSCLLYTYPSQRDRTRSRMPSSAWKKKIIELS